MTTPTIETLRSQYTAAIERHESAVEYHRKEIQASTVQILKLHGALEALAELESAEKATPDDSPIPDDMAKQDAA